MKKARSAFGLFLSFALTVFWGMVGALVSIFASRHVIKCAVRPWGNTVLRACDVNLSVSGVENVPHEPCIIMFNHQSSFDILAFSAAVPFEWKAVMKKEVARIPVIGWVCSLSGQYFVARDGSAEDANKVREIVKKIKKGPLVMIAPEGTRSKDGELLPFKDGGFLIAVLSKVPVVPMIIWGGKDVRKKTSWELNTGRTIRVSFLPPINVKEFSSGRKGVEELKTALRETMLSEIEKIRSQPV